MRIVYLIFNLFCIRGAHLSNYFPFKLFTEGYFLSLKAFKEFSIPKSHFDIDLFVHVRIILDFVKVLELKLYFCILFRGIDNFPSEPYLHFLVKFIVKFNFKASQFEALESLRFNTLKTSNSSF